MRYYVAYGSNMNKAQMAIRCPGAVPVGINFLSNMKLTFRGNSRGFGVANVEPEEGSRVPVGVWMITESDERALDRYEGFPFLYDKHNVRLKINGQEEKALIYIMCPGHQITEPSDSYYDTIKQGYRDFGLKLRPLGDALVRAREWR